jgi:hypothetical protein
MTVQEFLKKTYEGDEHDNRPRIYCKDGFNMSVQGGTSRHYCEPRELCNIYTKVEIGYPSQDLRPVLEDYTDPDGTIYAYVPIEEVELIVADHGGIDYEKTEVQVWAVCLSAYS